MWADLCHTFAESLSHDSDSFLPDRRAGRVLTVLHDRQRRLPGNQPRADAPGCRGRRAAALSGEVPLGLAGGDVPGAGTWHGDQGSGGNNSRRRAVSGAAFQRGAESLPANHDRPAPDADHDAGRECGSTDGPDASRSGGGVCRRGSAAVSACHHAERPAVCQPVV